MEAPPARLSAHEVKVHLVFGIRADHWLANSEVAKAAEISPRTARLHTSSLVKLRVLDAQRLFRASKFRLATEPGDTARALLERRERHARRSAHDASRCWQADRQEGDRAGPRRTIRKPGGMRKLAKSNVSGSMAISAGQIGVRGVVQ